IELAAGKTDQGNSRIRYDDFRKQLSFSGGMAAPIRDAIKAAAGAGATAFATAMDQLYDKSRSVVAPFFGRYPELQARYDAYVADAAPSVAEKRNNLLKAILPDLIQRRKRQQAIQAVIAGANTDAALTQAILDPAAAP